MFKKLSMLILGLSLSMSVLAVDVDDLTQKANQGDVDAQLTLADYYYYQVNNYYEAFYWTEKLALQGNAKAQLILGDMYSIGLGVEKNYQKALDWYTKSALQNNTDAKNRLALRYELGIGVRQDKSVSKEWYGQACDNGNQYGCDNYRILNEQGH